MPMISRNQDSIIISKTRKNVIKNATGWKNFQYITDGTQPVYIGSVNVTTSVYQLNVGQTLQLSYTIKPERATETAVTWNSINETIATVNNSGLVTEISFGTAEIRCSPQKGNGSPGSIYLAIYGNSITSFSVSPSTVYLDEGNSQNMDINILPSNASNKTLRITSSDNTVAYGEGNTIYGVKEGAAIIKYETTDGSNLYAQVIVVVSKPTSIDNLTDNTCKSHSVRKTFMNNRLYIQKGHQRYDMQGREVIIWL